METKANQTKFKKILMPILIVVGILLLVMTLKTQSVILSDGELVKVRMDYSVMGLCMRLIPMTDEAQAIASADVFIMDSIENTTEKAAKFMIENNKDATLELYVSGFPRNNDVLTDTLIERLAKMGITAKKIEV